MKGLFKCTGDSCSECAESQDIVTISYDSFVEARTILYMMGLDFDENRGKYLFSSVDEFIKGYKRIMFIDKVINEMEVSTKYTYGVLSFIENQESNKKLVCINIEAPFTILSSIINPVELFKEGRKNRDKLIEALSLINSFLKDYSDRLGNKEVMVSLADPSGSYDIVGPRFFNEFIANPSIDIINYMKNISKIGIIHLCGRMSTALIKEGYAKAGPINLKEDIEYSKGILSIMKNKPIVIGNACTKMFNIKRKVIWEINIIDN